MEFPHPFRERREQKIDAAVMEAALVGAMDIRDSLAAQEPGPYALPLGRVPRDIEAPEYAARIGATAQELLGALGCHEVEIDRHITEVTSRVKPRRANLPLQRSGADFGPRIMFRRKAKKAETPG